jgi:branched-chain amino acid transport system substrate-binding protein
MNVAKPTIRQAATPIQVLFCLVVLSLVAAQCDASMPPRPTQPSENASIRVAILTPMTGELATFGETVRNGITMALDEWNDRGDLDGRSIAWVLEDTRCDPLEARLAAERVILEQGVRFIVGGVCSEAAVPIAGVAEGHEALFISSTATHPLVTVNSTGATRPTVFRSAYVYPYQGRAAARFALDSLGARRAAVLIDPGDDFVRSLAHEFTAAFAAGGGMVAATLTYSQAGSGGGAQDVDWGTLVADLAGMDPDVLYVPDAYPVANRVGSAVRDQGLDVVLLGSEVWDNGALDLKTLEGAYFTLHYSRETPSPLAAAWEERYLSAFALEPDTLAALGYDAAGLLTAAFASADSATPGEVARTMERMEYEGVTGRWRFDDRHNPLKPVVIVRIQGERVVFHDTVQPE